MLCGRKYLLPVALVAVTLACVNVPAVVGKGDAAEWLLNQINPGQIASGIVQSYMGNAGHSFVSCSAEAIEQRRITFACIASGIGVTIVIAVLVIVAKAKASLKERLEKHAENQAAAAPNVSTLQNPAAVEENLKEIRIEMAEIKTEIRQIRQQQPLSAAASGEERARGSRPSEV